MFITHRCNAYNINRCNYVENNLQGEDTEYNVSVNVPCNPVTFEPAGQSL